MSREFQIILSAIYFVFIVVLIYSPILYTILIVFMLKGTYDTLKVEKIKWVPLFVPIRRRLEVLIVGVLTLIMFFITPVTIVVTLILLFKVNNFWRIILIALWIYNYYDHHANFGVLDGNGWTYFRKSHVGRYVRSYFPVELIKTAELKPNKNYVIACFPHAIISFAPTVNCTVDLSQWLKLFPGIRPKLATLDIHLSIPLVRQYLIRCGFASASKESLLYYLNKSNDPFHKDNKDGFSSYAMLISVGGSKESSESRPGCYKLTLKNRKGFVKIAIMTGSSIVPSFSFNEVDSYDQIFAKPGSMTLRFQQTVKNLSGYWPAMIVGRGFFQYTFGILPRRSHLVQVVGAPIAVEKCSEPDAAYVDEIHQKVILAVEELFETHKARYLKNYKDTKLIIN